MANGVEGFGVNNKLWEIYDTDRKEIIVGQFAPGGLTHNISGNIVSGTNPNSQYPIIQWLSGELEVVSFEVRLWAKDSLDFSIQQRFERLQNLVIRNDDLKRPPICTFTWGNLDLDCLIRSLRNIRYDDLRNDGTQRGITCQLTLERYEEVTLEATDSSVPDTDTRIRKAKKSDTYESIAQDEYGNAELGVLLRQKNPRKLNMLLSDLNVGDPVHIYSETKLLQLPIEPQFHAFKSGPGNEAAEERRREMFEARSDDKYTTIFG